MATKDRKSCEVSTSTSLVYLCLFFFSFPLLFFSLLQGMVRGYFPHNYQVGMIIFLDLMILYVT